MRVEPLSVKSPVNIFIYLPPYAERISPFLERIGQLPPEAQPEVFGTLDEFKRRLRRPKSDSSITIVYCPSREDLSALSSVREYLGKVHLLLVLPDQEAATLALAHRLLPSFITYVDSDLSMLLSVVNKLWNSALDERV